MAAIFGTTVYSQIVFADDSVVDDIVTGLVYFDICPVTNEWTANSTTSSWTDKTIEVNEWEDEVPAESSTVKCNN